MTTTTANAGIAPYADSREGSYQLQRERTHQLRRSVARHPHCRARATNLAQAESELESRHAQAWPRESTAEERAAVAALAAALLA